LAEIAGEEADEQQQGAGMKTKKKPRVQGEAERGDLSRNEKSDASLGRSQTSVKETEHEELVDVEWDEFAASVAPASSNSIQNDLTAEQMFSNMKLDLEGALRFGLVKGLSPKAQTRAAEIVPQMRLYKHDPRRQALTIELPPGKKLIDLRLVDELEMIAQSKNYPFRYPFVFIESLHQPQSAGSEDVGLQVVSGRDVRAAAPTFFLHPYFPDAALSLLFGDGGTGKTSLALWMLARVSRGEEVFGQPTHPQDVMMLSNEDAPEISQARFLAYGGDRNRISYERFDGSTFALANIEKLKETVGQYRPKVLVIDSVMSHLGGNLDAYRHNEVSSVLSPLQAIAEQFQTVIIGLMHMNKQDASKAIYRVGGSVGFVTASRSALFVEVKPDEPDARILCHVKANYSAHGRSQEFRIIEHRADHIGRIQYVGESDLTANDLLAKSDGGDGGKKLRVAEEFLNDKLLDGAMPANELYALADELGISNTTLERAKKKLGIVSRRSEDNSHFVWVSREKVQKSN
jgi:RecA/RadA recombinase